MISFFTKDSSHYFVVQSITTLHQDVVDALSWLFGGAAISLDKSISGNFIGPRPSMITPWSTNAVEITQNMGFEGIVRIEEYYANIGQSFDKMLQQKLYGLHQNIFENNHSPEPIKLISDVSQYNQIEGLSLNDEEVDYLNALSKKLGRLLTDSEVFGFSQVNSEHCRHKIFNGTFIIDNDEKPDSLFKLIKKTSSANHNEIVSAYKDNVAFINGPTVEQFAPKNGDKPSDYQIEQFESVLSLKAETHNFPTTVEPFNGAATGSGGEIRDRLAGGQGSIPMAGTAVYMTPYSRINKNMKWSTKMEERPWLYQTPIDILIKASNGASDFGNKFGQPLICGSLLTFEHEEHNKKWSYDKVIMQAGGIGYGKKSQAHKGKPKPGDVIVVLGGDNYRIGMGGAAVSSSDTGAFSEAIELNAVQRSNPEMQKRVANTIRALVESARNPIISIHDHGAGGHLNCLSELIDEVGGEIYLDNLPVGDPTLSAKELLGNESQERMGLIISEGDVSLLQKIAERERSPMYIVGKVTGDERFTVTSWTSEEKPIDLGLKDLFGSSPKTIMKDTQIHRKYDEISYDASKIYEYVEQVLRLESVACKDWLTNKVDRCVGGKVALQQCVGELQLPLNNCGIMALDYDSTHSIATSIGHAPLATMIHVKNGMQNAVAEAITNIIFAPLEKGIKSISLSANWMWPCKNPGEDARLYEAVKTISKFSIELGINIPTGKDSLSMSQKYKDGTVLSPGTVIISAIGHCTDFTKVVQPVLKPGKGKILYINFSEDDFSLGGSAFAQILNKLGTETFGIKDSQKFVSNFNTIQDAVFQGLIAAGHDISSGGMITSLLEMCFASKNVGASIDLTKLNVDIVKSLFAENSGIIIQANDEKLASFLTEKSIPYYELGIATNDENLNILHHNTSYQFNIEKYRDIWFETSFLLDNSQTANGQAQERFNNYKNQELNYIFPSNFTGALSIHLDKRPQAAVVREKGSNSERELANALYRSGFDVRDVHMTDLISGRENLEDVRFLGAVGGFSNSDVLGSAKGWAGAFKYNEKARLALNNFFKREDTLSIGICNGCQLFLELDLINPDHSMLSKMHHNVSQKHESNFTSVTIQKNHSVMMKELAGCNLGVWISHGEGRFYLPMSEDQYHIVSKYGYEDYPANPNGSDYNVAMLASPDGRHLVTMPHIERSYFAWNWAYYLDGRKDKVSPWALAFDEACRWMKKS